MEGTLAYLRALLCRRGLDQMRLDAQVALEGLNPISPYRPAMLHAQGAADLLQGDPTGPTCSSCEPLTRRRVPDCVPVIPMVLAERGIVAIARGDWSEAEALAAEAMAISEGGQFDDYWTSALVYAWGARVAANRGDVTQGRQLVARAARLRTLLTYALPVVSAQALLQMAHAYIALADAGGAHAVLKQIHDIHQHRRDLGGLVGRGQRTACHARHDHE